VEFFCYCEEVRGAVEYSPAEVYAYFVEEEYEAV